MFVHIISAFAIAAGLLAVCGAVVLWRVFDHPEKLPEFFEEGEWTPPLSGNSHDRRLARRRMARANKLGNA